MLLFSVVKLCKLMFKYGITILNSIKFNIKPGYLIQVLY